MNRFSFRKLLVSGAACTLLGSFAYAQVTNVDTSTNFSTLADAIGDATTLDGHTLSITADLPEAFTGPWKNVTLQGDDPARTLTGRLEIIQAGAEVAISSLVVDGDNANANILTLGDGAEVTLTDVVLRNSISNGARVTNTGGTLTWTGGISEGHAGNGIANQGGVVVATDVILQDNEGRGLFATNTGGSESTLTDCLIQNNNGNAIGIGAQLPNHTVTLVNTDLIANNDDNGATGFVPPGAQVEQLGGTFNMTGGAFQASLGWDIIARSDSGEAAFLNLTNTTHGDIAANNIITWTNVTAVLDGITITNATPAACFNPRSGTTIVRNSTITCQSLSTFGFVNDGDNPLLRFENCDITVDTTLTQFNNGSFEGGGEAIRGDNRFEIVDSTVEFTTGGNFATGANTDHTVNVVLENSEFIGDAAGNSALFLNNQADTTFNLTATGCVFYRFGNALVNWGNNKTDHVWVLDQCDFYSPDRKTGIWYTAPGSVTLTDTISTDCSFFNNPAGTPATFTEDYNYFDERGNGGLISANITQVGNTINDIGTAGVDGAGYCSVTPGDANFMGLDSTAPLTPPATLNSGNGSETYAGSKGFLCGDGSSVGTWDLY